MATRGAQGSSAAASGKTERPDLAGLPPQPLRARPCHLRSRQIATPRRSRSSCASARTPSKACVGILRLAKTCDRERLDAGFVAARSRSGRAPTARSTRSSRTTSIASGLQRPRTGRHEDVRGTVPRRWRSPGCRGRLPASARSRPPTLRQAGRGAAARAASSSGTAAADRLQSGRR